MALDNDLIGRIVSEWARTEIQKKDILNYNGAMLAYTDKARIANLLGLSDEQKLGVTPFPSPTTVAINAGSDPAKQVQDEQLRTALQPQSQPQKSEGTKSDWWKYLLAAVAASGVTVGGMALNKPTAPAPDSTTEAGKLGSVQLEMEGFPKDKNNNIIWGEQ